MAEMTGKSDLAGEIGKRSKFANLKQETYLNLVRTHVKLAGELARLFKQHGISEPQYNALRILLGEGKPMQIYEIAERMISPKTDISRMIERLAQNSLVSRVRCPDDGRVVWIELAAKGKAVLKKLKKPVEQLHESHFNDLSKAELRQLNQLLFRARKDTH